MDTKSVTFEVSSVDLSILDEIAANLEVDRASVIREAVTEYLASYEELKAESEEAMKDFNAGRSFSHEEVMKIMNEKMGKTLAA